MNRYHRTWSTQKWAGFLTAIIMLCLLIAWLLSLLIELQGG
jgi:hypothetical protein